ncbi:MAG: tRNA (guanosine(37)-N1)-methyltransferase TrmD [Gallicola sp.]|uniref:tRNA (guanosine(37)-N1)-methyltransferase TrmD n=1 Tax=Gallicola sp. Sow4_E12 TaxID=3438785 RepID=UPI0017B20A1E|nr:tRNA (guanosine(37)-N1)-methyltransferase TrmD [Gallicola sp.]
MRFDVLTLFPDFIRNMEDYGVIGKSIQKEIIELNAVNIRDYSLDKHRRVDDIIYGGGAGMLMTPQPIFDAVESLDKRQGPVIYLSPQGKVLTQDLCKKLSEYPQLILLCGHYEGIDARVLHEVVDEEVSIGDYVLTGGELGAMVLIDAVSRMIPGVLGNEESAVSDSHYQTLLQYDSYTRPREYKGMKVPQVLLDGNHKKIEEWRNENAVENTKKKRPDLYQRYLQERIERD